MVFEVTDIQKLFENVDSRLDRLKDDDYQTRTDLYFHMRLHGIIDNPGTDDANPFIAEMLALQRPNEDQEIRNQRENLFRQKTVGDFEQVLNTLYRIWNPRLFSMAFPEMPARFRKQTLQNYILNDFPKFHSLYDYTTNTLFKKGLIDANGVVVIMPLISSIGEGLIKPIPFCFTSDKIMMIGKGHGLFLSCEHSGAEEGEGRVLYLVDTENIWRISEMKPNEWTPVLYYNHALGFAPIVGLPGDGAGDCQQSYLYGVTPGWDEALAIFTDMQAVRLRLSYPQKWEYRDTCNKCGGTGKNASKRYTGQDVTCTTCGGSGILANKGPAGVQVIDPRRTTSEGISPPFAGFVEANPALLKILPEDYEREIRDGYRSVNMSYLIEGDSSAQAQSGVSRQYGRMDLETFMHRVADGFYKMMERIIEVIATMRYGVQIPNQIPEILPTIERPNTFDLITASDRIAQIALAKEAGVSAGLIDQMELEVARKEFGEDSIQAKKAEAVLGLDPLGGMSVDEIVTNSLSVSSLNRFIHANIGRLIDELIEADEGFLELPRPQQREQLIAKAKAEEAQINRGLSTPTIETIE